MKKVEKVKIDCYVHIRDSSMSHIQRRPCIKPVTVVSLDLEEIGEYVIRTGRTKDQQTETKKIFANDIFIEKTGLTKIRYDVESLFLS